MTYKKVILIIIGLLIAASPYMLHAENIEEVYSKILLNETDMLGYELGFQSKYFWGISDSTSKEGIVQIWNNEGIRIEVFYCKFDSATEALYGTEYYSSTFSIFWTFGSFYGPIVGDKSWFAEERSGKGIIFARGNVGIHINSIITKEDDLNITEEIIHKVLDKIEENLDEEIILKEQDVREQQITDTRYLQITEDTIKSETMTGYSFFTDWDSKWLVDENNFLMGKRMEWVNARGSLIGIDICEFDSEDTANSAVRIKTKPIEGGIIKTPSFDLNDLSTLDLLIKDWPGVFSNKFISGICFEGKTALHVYQFGPEKIYTEEFKAIATQLATTLYFIETSVADEEDTTAEAPHVFELFQNRPNPFNPVTTIRFVLYVTEQVSLKVYDILGSEVAILVDEYLEAGNHEVVWQGTDNEGNHVSSGIYLYSLRAGGIEETRSMTFVR